MPVSREYSVVANSTSASSPSPSTTPSVKRVMRTYGHPKECVVDNSYSSASYSATSSVPRGRAHRTGPRDLNEEVPLCSDLSHFLSDAEVGDGGRADSPHDASTQFQFDWKKRLKQIDEQDDFDVETRTISDTGNAPDLQPPLFGQPLLLQRPNSAGPRDVSTSPSHSNSTASTGDASGQPLSIYINSPPLSQIRFAAGNYPPLSPHPARRRLSKGVHVSDSDPELAENKDSPSTISPILASTPKHQSPPTPPASDDDMPAHAVPRSRSKCKSRTSTVVSRRNVAPLTLEDDVTGTSTSNHKKNLYKDERSRKLKIKAPTKKEFADIARSRLRITVDRRISIPRTDGASNKFTIQNLFSSIARQPAPESDPIAEFSSPPTVTSISADQYLGISTSTLLEDDGSSLLVPIIEPQAAPALKAMTSVLDLGSDSDNMTRVGDILANEQTRSNIVQIQQDLLENKKRAMALQSARADSQMDGDDELEIVDSDSMQAVVKEEEKKRKIGKKRKISDVRKRQLAFGGIRLAHQKTPSRRVSKLPFGLGIAGSFKGSKDKELLGQGDLNKALARRVHEENKQLIRTKEEEWIRRGGRMLSEAESASIPVDDVWQAYAEKGLMAAEHNRPRMEGDEDGGSDEDWVPGSASPSSKPSDERGSFEVGDPENESKIVTMVEDDSETTARNGDADHKESATIWPPRHPRAIIDSDTDDENSERGVPSVWNVGLLCSGHTRAPNSTFSTQGSADTNVMLSPNPRPSMKNHHGSLSSLDEATEDEGDKENNASLMFDQSEDKENKAVVRHAVEVGKSPLGARKGEDEMSTSRLDTRGGAADGEGDENQDRRKSYKALSTDEDPLSSQAGLSKASTSFVIKVKRAPSAAKLTSSTSLTHMSFVDVSGRNPRFSQFSDGGSSTFGGTLLQPGFSDLFEATEKPKSAPFLRPLRLSGPFSDEQEPGIGQRRKPSSDGLDLTQDIALQPAFQIDSGLVRRADEIFEKEQAYLLEAANRKPHKQPELYVNDHGFLTQTRPDVSSPEIYRPPATQNLDLYDPQPDHSQFQRHPLRTLSLAGSVDFDSSDKTPLRRLAKRSISPQSAKSDVGDRLSPSASQNTQKRPAKAFHALRPTMTKIRKVKRKLSESEFVEAEAQESDDDEMFGFMPTQRNDIEEDGDDLDMSLAELVDDQIMDEETVAANLVLEKFKEQEEQADRENEKLHQAAVQGELRRKKRNHGVGMDDTDNDSEEDEANRKIRRGMNKKQKIDRSNIIALAEHEETRSFFNVYEDDLMDNDNGGLSYLRQSQDVVTGDHEGVDESDEPREFVTWDELQWRVREAAQQEELADALDPHDVAWIDVDSEDEDSTRTKPIKTIKTMQPGTRKEDLDQAEFEDKFGLRKPVGLAGGNFNRMKSWAKLEGRSRTAGTTGHFVGGIAVTGHGKTKAGGGSLCNRRLPATSTSTSTSLNKPSEKRRLVKSTPSMLAGVADRNARFESR